MDPYTIASKSKDLYENDIYQVNRLKEVDKLTSGVKAMFVDGDAKWNDLVLIKVTYYKYKQPGGTVVYVGQYDGPVSNYVGQPAWAFTNLVPIAKDTVELPDLKAFVGGIDGISHSKSHNNDNRYIFKLHNHPNSRFEFYKVSNLNKNKAETMNIDELMRDLKSAFDEMRIQPVEEGESTINWLGEEYRDTIDKLYRQQHEQKMSKVFEEMRTKTNKNTGGKRKYKKTKKHSKRRKTRRLKRYKK